LTAVGIFAQDCGNFFCQGRHLLLLFFVELLQYKIRTVDLLGYLRPDTDTNPAIVLGAEHFGDGLDTIVAGRATADTGTNLPESNIEFIVDDHDMLGRNLIKMCYRLHGFPTQVHKGCGFEGDDFAVADSPFCHADLHVFLFNPRAELHGARKRVDALKTNVVTRPNILVAGVTEADDKQGFIEAGTKESSRVAYLWSFLKPCHYAISIWKSGQSANNNPVVLQVSGRPICYNAIMHKLFQLCKPGADEVVFYLFVGFFVLFAVNIPGWWQLLLSASHTDPETAQTLGTAYRQYVSNTVHLSDPQIVNAFIWGLTAAVGLVIAAGLADFLRAEAEDRRTLHQKDGAATFFIKLGLRLAAFVGIIAFGSLFIAELLPYLAKQLYTGVVHPLRFWYAIPLALFAILMTSVCLYIFALMLRLLVLRVRVFSDYIG
jgi:hypothetical protein